MKVYLYSRVSTASQSFEQQERTAYEWLKSHNMQVDEVVSDFGIGGGVSYKERNLGRVLIPKLQPNDLLIVSEISRLGRSMYDVSTLINTDLKERKIRLVIVCMGIDLNCNELKPVDQLILNNFAFSAALEKQMNNERILSAMKVCKQKGIKIGKASENYKVNEENQKNGRIKSARKITSNSIAKPEFLSFCRILRRTINILQDVASTDDNKFMLNWNDKKQSVMDSLDKNVLSEIRVQMRNAREDNNALFAKYSLDDDDYQLKVIRAKIGNTFTTIANYINSNA